MKELTVSLGRGLKPSVGFLSFSDEGSPHRLSQARVLPAALTGTRSPPRRGSIILYNYGYFPFQKYFFF